MIKRQWEMGYRKLSEAVKTEPVLYEAQPVEIRANWDVQLSITLF